MTLTSEDTSKTTTVSESIDVDAPINQVYNQWTQFSSFPQFMDGIESIEQLDDTHLNWKAKVGGVEREWRARVTEQAPEDRVAWTSEDGKFNAGAVTFHKISDTTTRVHLEMDWSPEGAVEKIGAGLGFDDRQIKHDLEKFKDLMESNGFTDSGWRGTVERE